MSTANSVSPHMKILSLGTKNIIENERGAVLGVPKVSDVRTHPARGCRGWIFPPRESVPGVSDGMAKDTA